jgi:5'-deoxynucleotidase
MHSIIPDYLSSHSLEVGFLAHALAVIGNEHFEKNYDCDRITVKAIFHDVPEILTGDIPTPVKYYSSETREAYASVEAASIKKLTEMLPQEYRETYLEIFNHTDEESIVIKAADRISAYIKCLDEKNYGNREFEIAGERLLSAIKEMKCPEAEYFLDNFLDSFGLPIDSIIDRE